MNAPRRPPRPLVSVIVPIHDRFSVARRALESVYAQTHRPIEAIVVDDASSPSFAPPSVAESKSVSVRVRRIEQNAGPGGAREAGRRLVSGELIAYLDSDDAWHPDHLSGLVEALERNPDAGMAWAPAIEMREGDERSLRRFNDEAHDRILPILLWGRPWHTSACLWRRSLSDAIGPWMPLWTWEDYEHDCRAGTLGATIVRGDAATCYVGCDAPDRQSDAARDTRKADSFGRAILAMSWRLAGTEWAADPAVRDRMRGLLLGAAARAAESRLKALAAELVHETRRWSNSRGRLAVAAYGGVPMLGLLRGALSARIFRWARRVSGSTAARPAAPTVPVIAEDIEREANNS
ncbi:MAG TPA: glycosyltransferase family A protein [Thermoanaerobaculia bacterium]|nr:glycosyltransferase family A protein [Thermoanaerobaculia bacterium]